MDEVKKRIGFLGAGNMARAIAGGVVRAGLVRAEDVVASDVVPQQLEEFTRATNYRSVNTNREVIEFADIVIFAVKPFHVADVCAEIADLARSDQLFVSICAGIRSSFIEKRLGGTPRVIRVMPNTPALIGCGATAISAGRYARADDIETVRRLFDAIGITVVLEEDLLDVVTGLSGSGPAYVFCFAECLIQAAQKLGLPDDAATKLVLQTLYGASKMALESGKPLAELRQAVTTKGGTTEAGLRVLSEGGFSTLVEKCVEAATCRSRELSGEKEATNT
ncbi:MAG: pyrroline-5-carboxylate reductase [Candidatus Sumerlaea chitinivorans]|nr:pyrroline-5-carboxylate reductase [Candidatus Sumerlaea chitinivorans]